jgi:hypothetical protein
MCSYLFLQPHSIFPENWFPFHSAASAFMILFFAWILSELINIMWSKKNLQTTKQDEGSNRIISVVSYGALLGLFTK